MNEYKVTFWTGTVEHVKAESVRAAYYALGYTDQDESYLWDESDNGRGLGYVSGAYGDICATIVRIA